MQEKVFTFTDLVLFSAEVGGEFAERPTFVLKFSEGGERLLPPEQENETLHLHEKQPLTWCLHLSYKSGAPLHHGNTEIVKVISLLLDRAVR